jgi:hypothetical protein
VVARRSILLALAALGALALAATPASALRPYHHADPAKVFKKKANRPFRVRARVSVFSSSFASNWTACTASTTERARVPASNAPQVKVVYAYPTDTGDQFSSYSDLIQADAKAVRDRIANEPGSQKTVRFDTGANCTSNAENYLDIQKVALPNNRAYYNSPPTGVSTFKRLTDDLKAVLATPSPPGARVNYLVYADRIQKSGASGEATAFLIDTKSLENPNNQGSNGDGRMFAVVYGNPTAVSADFDGYGDGARRVTFLHELTHTLGAVQLSAPNTSGAGHCIDELDIMCYDDGGPGTSGGMQSVCNTGFAGDFSESYDCGNDDYFNPSPTAGSFLADNWNSYDSVFLCNVSNCDLPLTAPSGASVSTTHTGGALGLEATVTTGTVEHYEWDTDGDGFYDVDTGTDPTVTPEWFTPGTRTVAMRASAADGSFVRATVAVTPTTPVPHFSVSGKLAVGETLQLNGNATTDPDGLITSFNWDRDGDGTYETDTGLTRTTSTSFSAPGTTTLGLEVEYPFGASFSRTAPFTIAPPTPTPASTPPATTTTSPATTTTTTAPLQPTPTILAAPSFAFTKVSLKKLLGSGLPLRITCAAPCKASFKLVVDAKTAKRLHLKGSGKTIRIGSASGQFASGTTKPMLKLTAAAKKALKRVRSLTATLTGSVTQGLSTPLPITKAISFKR